MGHTQADELQHDVARLASLLGVDAEIGEVIDNHHLDVVSQCESLNLIENMTLLCDIVHTRIIDVGDKKPTRELLVGVSHGQLYIRKFEVDV